MCCFTEVRSQVGIRGCTGQATVEAALLIPLVFLLLLVMCEPAILLYNRIVMANAAAEGCRLLATKPASAASDTYEAYVRRRLGSIPTIDIFHVRSGERSWQVELAGDDSSAKVSVTITNKVLPLPLLGWGAELAGLADPDGYLTQTAHASFATQPAWALENGSPEEWVQQWN